MNHFFGGGAVFFYLEPRKAVINDLNSRLMTFYQEIKTDYPTMRKQLDDLQAIYESNQAEYERLRNTSSDQMVENKNEALYYRIRDMFNHKIPSDYLESVLYFFINKTAYSGMIRYNSKGEYNVPFGRYQNFNTHLITDSHAELVGNAKLLCGDYTTLFSMAEPSDFMFLDPPYDCVFNNYGNLKNPNGFDEQEHRRLAKAFRSLKCQALMVIGKTPLTEELYGEFIKGEYDKTYTVNIRNRFKSEAKHIIVTNY